MRFFHLRFLSPIDRVDWLSNLAQRSRDVGATKGLLLLFATLFATACADDDLQPRRNETNLEALNRLVPITQTGAGTFGCLLNAELWIPEAVFEEEAVDARYFDSKNTTIVTDKQPISDNRDQRIVIGSVFTVGSKTSLKSLSKWTDSNRSGECRRIYVDTTMTNYMLVTHFDQSNKIISGLFEAIMTNPDCPQDTIKITEGRFDLRYRF